MDIWRSSKEKGKCSSRTWKWEITLLKNSKEMDISARIIQVGMWDCMPLIYEF